MANWTPTRSILLSKLLDNVVGTEDMVRIRQDYCKIWDCILSARKAPRNYNVYYTGSKAEGLDLRGSDRDFMIDINNMNDIQVIQTQGDSPDATRKNLFIMCTPNISPCFVMLRNVAKLRNRKLLDACQYIDNALHLSSYLYKQNIGNDICKSSTGFNPSPQGPSLEGWDPYMDVSQPGVDRVPSIHCPFWPQAANEWQTRSDNSHGPLQVTSNVLLISVSI